MLLFLVLLIYYNTRYLYYRISTQILFLAIELVSTNTVPPSMPEFWWEISRKDNEGQKFGVTNDKLFIRSHSLRFVFLLFSCEFLMNLASNEKVSSSFYCLEAYRFNGYPDIYTKRSNQIITTSPLKRQKSSVESTKHYIQIIE